MECEMIVMRVLMLSVFHGDTSAAQRFVALETSQLNKSHFSHSLDYCIFLIPYL